MVTQMKWVQKFICSKWKVSFLVGHSFSEMVKRRNKTSEKETGCCWPCDMYVPLPFFRLYFDILDAVKSELQQPRVCCRTCLYNIWYGHPTLLWPRFLCVWIFVSSSEYFYINLVVFSLPSVTTHEYRKKYITN